MYSSFGLQLEARPGWIEGMTMGFGEVWQVWQVVELDHSPHHALPGRAGSGCGSH